MPEGATDIPAERFVRLLSSVGFVTARAVGRFDIPAALVRFTGDMLACAATDSHRFALAQTPMVAAPPCEFLFPWWPWPVSRSLLKARYAPAWPRVRTIFSWLPGLGSLSLVECRSPLPFADVRSQNFQEGRASLPSLSLWSSAVINLPAFLRSHNRE
jgi:hypothetical protein